MNESPQLQVNALWLYHKTFHAKFRFGHWNMACKFHVMHYHGMMDEIKIFIMWSIISQTMCFNCYPHGNFGRLSCLIKVGIVLRWITFLALWFLVGPTTYDPPIHSGGIMVSHIFPINYLGHISIIDSIQTWYISNYCIDQQPYNILWLWLIYSILGDGEFHTIHKDYFSHNSTYMID